MVLFSVAHMAPAVHMAPAWWIAYAHLIVLTSVSCALGVWSYSTFRAEGESTVAVVKVNSLD